MVSCDVRFAKSISDSPDLSWLYIHKIKKRHQTAIGRMFDVNISKSWPHILFLVVSIQAGSLSATDPTPRMRILMSTCSPTRYEMVVFFYQYRHVCMYGCQQQDWQIFNHPHTTYKIPLLSLLQTTRLATSYNRVFSCNVKTIFFPLG